MTRRYEVSYLDSDGNIESVIRLAPAISEFETAFSALARGTVIATTEGPVAIEDLVPGMVAITAEGRCETITWIGSMTLFPAHAMPGMSSGRMIRVTADAFGVGRPMPDVVLGPSARLLVRGDQNPDQAHLSGSYAPATTFVDGVSIIEVTPVTPVPVYHIMLERQGSIRAAGLDIESYHPGPELQNRFGVELSQRFLSLFPHLQGFSGFGAMAHPRMTAKEVEAALVG
ncbi:Hint domain-containing protein [Defluviimonas aestuarii]|uniref:Hint domain-containing protein n=1 Tax=Albidovulum aestuarii TaxID=1130726 RepID=UPI00249AB9F8|nr:Hint domain-containing protein [Defluviimonas aestuarii]MDI3337008.1 Hint domain-containing protein [Defluviimonas aestuarii]